jgi:hypothetical protein
VAAPKSLLLEQDSIPAGAGACAASHPALACHGVALSAARSCWHRLTLAPACLPAHPSFSGLRAAAWWR